MQQPRRDVWTALTGVLAAVLFVAGLICTVAGPNDTDSDSNVLAWYSDHGHRVTNLIGAYLIAVCGLMLLAFLAGLHRRLRVADASGTLANVALGGGIVLVAMLWMGTAAVVAISGAKSFGGDTGPQNVDIARFLPQVGYAAILLFAMFAAIAVIVPTSLVVLRSGILPRWFAWLGFVCAAALLLGVVFLPMVALPIWLVAAGAAALRRPAAEPAHAGLRSGSAAPAA